MNDIVARRSINGRGAGDENAVPIRCRDTDGTDIQSFDLTDEQWNVLEGENRRSRDQRMACCSAQVTLRRSELGTQFFVHLTVEACATGDETKEHLHLKMMAIDVARACGWYANAEVSGASPSWEPWQADVLASNGKHKVAIEIQWTGQTVEETTRRQRRYVESGVRGLLLLRQPVFRATRDLPAACVRGSLDEDFFALLPAHARMKARDRANPSLRNQAVPMEAFLRAAFERRLKFAKPQDGESEVTVHVAQIDYLHSGQTSAPRCVSSGAAEK